MNILDQIVAQKKLEVAALIPRAQELRGRAELRKDYRDFEAALSSTFESVGLIAEVKKASPSAGVICANFVAVKIARQYEIAGANALSVLTDREFFQGKLEFLEQIRSVVKLPLLRKDFIIDELQIYEAGMAGADAILLIVAILDDRQLRDYLAVAKHLRLAALVEVHDEMELDRALVAGAKIIGINNRNLKDFSVSLAITETLAGKLAGMEKIIVAESGINTHADVERVRHAGAQAILVGESLMRSGDIPGKVKELLNQ